MLVSVVIPSYNHSAYIRDCLQSIAAQTYSHIEVIVVDDNSADDTYEQARLFAQDYRDRLANIVVIRNSTNRGAHFSLNRGAALSQGRYIFFMNSDDMYTVDRVDEMLAALLPDSRGFGFSDVTPIDETGNAIYSEPLCHSIAMSAVLAADVFPSISWGLLWRQIGSSTGNFVVSRDLLNQIGGFRNLRYCHDWDFALRAIIEDEPVYVRKQLYKYRFHAGNSFKSLSDVAVTETERVVKSYLARVMTKQPANPKCPAPQNYPRSFEFFLRRLPVFDIYRKMYTPYLSHHRTVDRQHVEDRAALG
jgi:glycosyltransferase involved in cell wall biosynthesis